MGGVEESSPKELTPRRKIAKKTGVAWFTARQGSQRKKKIDIA